jgi:hypothetical protein
MDKPTKRTKESYDYHECRDYINAKLGRDQDDYAGMFKRNASGKLINYDPSKEFLCFWHWVIENYTISNGCFVTFHRERLEEINEPWIKEIYGHYIDEFADESGELEMYVWW